MKDYSKIYFQLDLSREQLQQGNPHEAMEALIRAFDQVRDLEGSRFRLFAAQIWHEVSDIQLVVPPDPKISRQTRFLYVEIDNTSREREDKQSVALPSLNAA